MYGMLIYMPDGERGMTYENDNEKDGVINSFGDDGCSVLYGLRFQERRR